MPEVIEVDFRPHPPRDDLQTLAERFINGMEVMRPRPLGRRGYAKLPDGTEVSRVRAPGFELGYFLSFSREGSALYLEPHRNHDGTLYLEHVGNDAYWREWFSTQQFVPMTLGWQR